MPRRTTKKDPPDLTGATSTNGTDGTGPRWIRMMFGESSYRWLEHAHYDHPEKSKQAQVISIIDGTNFMREKETQAAPSSFHRTGKAIEST